MLTTIQCLSCGGAYSYERVAASPGRLRQYCDECRAPHRRANGAKRQSLRSDRECEICAGVIPAAVHGGRRLCDGCRAKPARRLETLFATAKCGVCDAAFYPVTARPRRYCSRDCGEVASGKTHLSDRCLVIYGTCMDCGSTIVANNGKRRCPACHLVVLLRRRSTLKKKRRARKNEGAENFTTREIAERDGWTCHICSEPIPDRPFKGWADDLTLDHLIPIAKGGRHRRNNVKAAHFHCNSERQDAELPGGPAEWWETCGYVA